MKDYQYYLSQIGEYGDVLEINYPIVAVAGLPHAKSHELVIFENGSIGEVFSVEKDKLEVILYSRQAVRIKTKVVRTDEFVSLPVGDELLGSIVDPLGRSLSNGKIIRQPEKTVEVDREIEGISKRSRIRKPFPTGISLVDLFIPLGCGQRELILGDRKTGKTSFLMTVIKNQVAANTIVVYAAICKKKSDIKKLEEFLTKEGIFNQVVIVATDPNESPSLIFLTPYSAMSIAEFFKDKGKNVLIIFDDLSVHGKFYREISLLSKRFPGRESYPGDMFYTHARLLERAGNFKIDSKRDVSITALPIAETVDADLTGFISTNLMGMTDGHIFFDSDSFSKGRRPAINIPLSVTRVGRQTQSVLKREINREITAFLGSYDRIQSFSHFGAELSEKIKSTLRLGEKLQTFFDQDYHLNIPEEVQLVILSLIWLHHLDDKPNDRIDFLKKSLTKAYGNPEIRKMMQAVVSVPSFHQLLIQVAKKKDDLMRIGEQEH